MDGPPLEVAPAAAAPAAAAPPAAVAHLAARAAAAAELAGMFWQHAASSSWFAVPLWSVAGQQQQHQQQQWPLHPALAAAGAGGVQQQLMSVVSYLAQPQQHNQPEMYCMDAELLARSC